MAKKKSDDENKNTKPDTVVIRRKRGIEKKDEQQIKNKTDKPSLLLLQGKKVESDKSESNKEKPQPAYSVEVKDFLVQEIAEEKGKLSIKDAARAIIQADGYITRAARILRITYQTLKKLIEKTPSLKMLLDDVIESTNDLAESKLKQQIAAGNLSAIIFHLKCKARHRGWVEDESKAASSKENKPIVFNYQLVKTRKDVQELAAKQERADKENVSA